MIVCFLSNISAKYYKNPSMLSRVIAKNVGDAFLRHSVYFNVMFSAVIECDKFRRTAILSLFERCAVIYYHQDIN